MIPAKVRLHQIGQECRTQSDCKQSCVELSRRKGNHDDIDYLHDGHDANAHDGEPALPGNHSLVLGPLEHHETLDAANLRLQVALNY